MLDLLIQESNNKISILSTTKYAHHESFFVESLNLISDIRKTQIANLNRLYSSISEECKDNAYGEINDHFLEYFSGYDELINTSAKQMSNIIDTAVKDLQVKIKESTNTKSNTSKPIYEYSIKPGIRGNIVNIFENPFTNIETKSYSTTDMISVVNEMFIAESANKDDILTAFRSNLCESELDVDMDSFGRELFASLRNGNTSPHHMITSVHEVNTKLIEAVTDCQNMKNTLNRDCKALIESVNSMIESIDTNGLYAADKYRVPGSNTTKFSQDAVAKMNMLVKLKLEEAFTCMNYQIMAIGAKLDAYNEQAEQNRI